MSQSQAESTWEITKIYQPIPPEYHKINTAIQKD